MRLSFPRQPLEGPAVEREVAGDLARRGVMIAPVLIAIAAAIWGLNGALSVAFGIGLVVVNFGLAALLLSWGARISLAALGACALGGFLLRMALIVVAVLSVRHQWWVEIFPLMLTVAVVHLGLLAWETRYLSISLAAPGLKPRTQRRRF
jgi:hypothetical protein